MAEPSDNFVSEKYALELDYALRATTVAAQVCGNNYTIGTGDTVHIWTPDVVTVRETAVDTALGSAESLAGTDTPRKITRQADYFFTIPASKKYDSALDLEQIYLTSATQQEIPAKIDSRIMGLYTGLPAGNVYTATAAVTSANIVEQLAALRTKMSKLKIPQTGRWLILPPEVTEKLIVNTASKASALGDRMSAEWMPSISGYVGYFHGFNIFESLNVVNTAENLIGDAGNENVFKCLAGYTQLVQAGGEVKKAGSIVYAQKIDPDEIIKFRPESGFDYSYKGRVRYDAWVMGTAASPKLCLWNAIV